MSTGHYEDPEIYDWMYGDRVEDIPFYVVVAKRTRGPVLEVGCGTGRVTIPMIDAGIDVTPVDTAPRMLDRLDLKLARARLPAVESVNPECKPWPPSSWVAAFGAAVAPFHVVNHFDLADMVTWLHWMRYVLRTGGLLAFDAQPLPRVFRTHGYAESTFKVFGPPAGSYRGEHTYDRPGRILTAHLTGAMPAGRVIDQTLQQRIWDSDKILDLAAVAGFDLVTMHGGFHGEPLTPDSPEHVYVFRKR